VRVVKINVNKELVDQLKEKYPETKGLTYTGLVDLMLRKVLKEASK